MTHDETHETLFDNTIRFERVIYMAGALAQGDNLPDDLRDFFGDEDDKTVLECFPGFPLSFREEGYATLLEYAAEWLIENYRMGYLVQVATPVMTYHKESGASSYSWGRYRYQWVYGHTMSEVVYKAVQWAKGQRESEKEKAK